MSMYIGKRNDNKGHLHLTENEHEAADMKSDYLPDTTFSSALPYLRVKEQVHLTRFYRTGVDGTDYAANIPSRAKDLIRQGYLYSVSMCTNSRNYWSTTEANKQPTEETIEVFDPSRQFFQSVLLRSDGGGYTYVAQHPSSGTPSNNCPWVELPPYPRGPCGPKQGVGQSVTHSGSGGNKSTTISGSLDTVNPYLLRGVFWTLSDSGGSGYPSYVDYHVDKETRFTSGIKTSQKLHLRCFTWTFYNFKVDFSSGTLYKEDPDNFANGIYIDNDDINIGDFSLIDDGYLVDITSPAIASMDNKVPVERLFKTFFTNSYGKRDSNIKKYPMFPTTNTALANIGITSNISAGTITQRMGNNGIMPSMIIPELMITGEPRSLEFTNQEINIYNSSKSQKLVIASPNTKHTPIMGSPLEVTFSGRARTTSWIRGGTRRSSTFGTFYERRERVFTYQLGKTLDEYPLLFSLRQGTHQVKNAHSSTAVFTGSDSSEQANNTSVVMMGRSTGKTLGNGSQYNNSRTLVHHQFQSSAGNTGFSSFFLECFVLGTTLYIDALYLHRDTSGAVSATYTLPTYKVWVYPLYA